MLQVTLVEQLYCTLKLQPCLTLVRQKYLMYWQKSLTKLGWYLNRAVNLAGLLNQTWLLDNRAANLIDHQHSTHWQRLIRIHLLLDVIVKT